MATRLSAGGIGSHDMVPLNIAAGAEPPSRGQATNLSGSHRPSTVLSHVEYFADEIVLNELEKRQIMGVPITRRISLAMLGCCCLATIVVAVMLTKAFSHGSSGSGGYEDQDQQPMELSAAEGKERYELFQSLLEPLVGGSVSVSGTPEASALYWMAYDDPARLNPRAKVDKVIQRFVLATLYYATNGEKWGKSYSFLSYNDECNWNHGSDSEIGAYCKADKRFVDTLILHNNNLNGTLPRDIGLLTHLSRVDMSGNDIRGHLPSTIGLLSKLTYLDFSENHLEGFAPNNAQKLTSLHILKLNNNEFEGEIPYNYLVDLPTIKEIDLSNNLFSGLVQDEMRELWGMQNLERLNLSNNKLQGEIPAFLREIDSLKFLDFSNNSFTGSLPSAYGKMQSLQQLDVSNNMLSGSIPHDFFGDGIESGTMTVFRASSNNFVGKIPTKLGMFQQLNILALDDNGLDGAIPTEIGTLSRLQILDLSKNSLLGSIPTEIKHCTSLIALDLSSNKLEFRIPSELGALGSLDKVDLRENLLVGSLPTELRNLPMIRTLYLSSNGIAGDLDTILCNRPEAYPSWIVFESDCLTNILSCSCCTSCCNGAGDCCIPGTASCNNL